MYLQLPLNQHFFKSWCHHSWVLGFCQWGLRQFNFMSDRIVITMYNYICNCLISLVMKGFYFSDHKSIIFSFIYMSKSFSVKSSLVLYSFSGVFQCWGTDLLDITQFTSKKQYLIMQHDQIIWFDTSGCGVILMLLHSLPWWCNFSFLILYLFVTLLHELVFTFDTHMTQMKGRLCSQYSFCIIMMYLFLIKG